ncbi:MAG TPA: HrcA family transcriptional regulator, partial [bacterium]|nr:HrcA family transcriptional regulator [bacterium]
MISLSEREYIVLRKIVQSFIENGTPIGSRTLSKILPWELSAATIRNIMADLEDKGFLTHPHTSAGRIPTD